MTNDKKELLEPTYYVQHPDGSYSVAEIQPKAIREQEAAKVAMLVDAAQKVVDFHGPSNKRMVHTSVYSLSEAISASTTEAEAFIREKQAEALIELNRKLSENDGTAMWNIKAMLDELRNAKEV